MAEEVPERPALILGDDVWSFRRLLERVERVAGGLRREGLESEQRAVVMIPMSGELYAALLGVLQIGAVAVFLDPWVGVRALRRLARLAEPQAFLGSSRAHWLRLLVPALRGLPVTVTTGRRLGPFLARRTLEELAEEPRDPRVHPRQEEHRALITLTTGSSGEPKGADRPHGFLLAQHRALAETFPYREGDVDMPMFPVFALNNLACGVPSVVPEMDFRRVDRVDGRRLLQRMLDHGVTTATASPPFFDALAEALESGSGLDSEKGERPKLRRILTGGAPVSDSQLRRWRRALPETEIVVAYGSTEAEPVAHIDADERLRLSAESEHFRGFCAGRPVPAVEARLVRIEAGALTLGDGGWQALEVAQGEVGELVVTGDHVCRRYFRSPEAEAANKITDGDGRVWHRMGDTGCFDPAGRFWLVGRVHSTVRRGDELLHPQLVEAVARGEDSRIRRAALVGLGTEDERRAVVVVESAGGAAVPADDLRSDVLSLDVQERLRAAGFAVDEVRVSPKPLPVDPRHASKIDYQRLRRRLGGR